MLVIKDTGRIFGHRSTHIAYYYLCSSRALAYSLGLRQVTYHFDVIGAGAAQVPEKLGQVTYYDHFLSVIPNNIMKPYLEGNVLSVMFISASVGFSLPLCLALEGREAVLKVLWLYKNLLFTLIKALLYVLPIGILVYELIICSNRSGVIVGALGEHTLPLLSAVT